MLTTDRLQPLKELLPTIRTALVILSPQSTLDHVASGIALHQALTAVGYHSLLLSTEPLPEELETLAGNDVLQHQLGNRDLNISFEYRAEAVDKVSYHIDEETQRFHLVIKPQKGQQTLDASTVQFSYSGADADVIFLIGVSQLESLEHLYFGFEQLYQTTPVVTFHTFEPEIGTIKLDVSGTSSLSESMMGLLKALELPLNPDSATHLLSSIETATNNFSSLATTAETFETIAELLRAGARRTRRAVAQNSQDFAHALQTKSPVKVLPKQSSKKTKIVKKDATSSAAEADDKSGSLQYQPSMGVSSR